MVDRVPSNPFAGFIRKIGFSVGLESTLARLDDFATLYASRDTIGYSDINRLLHAQQPEGWGLDPKNNHVLDVFRSLEIVSVKRGEVGILEVGDALGVLRRRQPDSSFAAALRLLFAETLIRADGDIFLNALAAAFDPTEFRERIYRMLEHKWDRLETVFRSPQQRAAIYHAINIDVQDNNPGSRGLGLVRGELRPASPFAPRGSLLASAARPEPRVSDAYLKKALPRRKAWAVSLGLATAEGEPTPAGTSFLSELSLHGMGGPCCMAVWPLAHELLDPTFVGVEFPDGITIQPFWDYLLLVRRALGYATECVAWSEARHDVGVDNLLELLITYRSLNVGKSVMRVELPARVAYRCALAAPIEDAVILPYPVIVAKEQERPSPRIVSRPSRLAEFALSV